MRSREWFLKQAIRETPCPTVVRQQLLDSWLVTFSLLRNAWAIQGDVDIVLIPASNSALGEVGVHKTFEGGHVCTISIMRAVVVQSLAELLAAIWEPGQFEARSVLSEMRYGVQSAIKRELLKAEAARLFPNKTELIKPEKGENVEAGDPLSYGDSINSQWPPDKVFWGAMSSEKRFKLLSEIHERLSRVCKMLDIADVTMAAYSLVFSALHEIGHLAYQHYEILGSFEHGKKHENATAIAVAIHYAHLSRAKKEKHGAGEFRIYKQFWIQQKEFEADWFAAWRMVEMFVGPSYARGEKDAALTTWRKIFWGITATFALIHLEEATSRGLGIERSREHKSNEFQEYPAAELRFAVLTERLRRILPFPLNECGEKERFLTRIFDSAKILEWDSLNAMAGMLLAEENIETERVKFWVETFEYLEGIARKWAKGSSSPVRE